MKFLLVRSSYITLPPDLRLYRLTNPAERIGVLIWTNMQGRPAKADKLRKDEHFIAPGVLESEMDKRQVDAYINGIITG